MELIFIIVAFLLLVLTIVWSPFLKQEKNEVSVDDAHRDQTNVNLYHEHKAEIEKDFQQGNIDEENYQYLLSELDGSLLQDMQQGEQNRNKQQEVKALSVVWPAFISVFVIVFSFVLYQNIGAYDKIANQAQVNPQQQQDPNVSAEEQAIAQIKELMELTRKEPENSDAWYSLGQVLVSIGEFDGALEAYDKVLAIEGEKADVYGAKAQATYYKNDQKIDEQVQLFIDKALALDAHDPSTNILLGMHSFISQNYQSAIEHWQTVVDSEKKSVNKQALIEAIAEAKNRLSLTGNNTGESDSQSAHTLGPQLSISVELTDEIAQLLSLGDDKTVFIYAIPADTSKGRMPVAAIKMKASDLPTTVVLNDARAMTPQAKLSDVEAVHLYAIVSASGGAGIKSGDYKAELVNIPVSTSSELLLVVDRIVP